jgi:hypothetical protein
MNTILLAKEVEVVTMGKLYRFQSAFQKTSPILYVQYTINPILIYNIQCPNNTVTIDQLQTIHKKGASYHPRDETTTCNIALGINQDQLIRYALFLTTFR